MRRPPKGSVDFEAPLLVPGRVIIACGDVDAVLVRGASDDRAKPLEGGDLGEALSAEQHAKVP